MAPCEAGKLRLSSSACTSSSHKVTKNINLALRCSVFSRIRDRLCDSSNETADVGTQAVTYVATADHFVDTCVHARTRAAQHSVMPPERSDAGSPVPSLVSVRDVLLSPTLRPKQMWQAAENQLIRADVCQ